MREGHLLVYGAAAVAAVSAIGLHLFLRQGRERGASEALQAVQQAVQQAGLNDPVSLHRRVEPAPARKGRWASSKGRPH